MRTFRWVGIAVAVLVVVYLALAKFSTSESVWVCKGELTRAVSKTVEQTEAYLRLQKYRPWVVWSSSYGDLHLEVPKTTFAYYSHIVELGDSLTIYDDEGKDLKGMFSLLSHSLMIDTGMGVFEGMCVER